MITDEECDYVAQQQAEADSEEQWHEEHIKMNKELEFLQEHCEFNKPHEVYVLLAVSRKKDTPWITNSQEIVFREVIKNPEDIARKLNRIKLMCENYKDKEGRSYPFYIYITNNSRCSMKAARAISWLITDCLYDEAKSVDMSSTLKKIDYKFISCLMKKHSKGSTRYFMIDVDTKDKDFNIRVMAKVSELTREGVYVKVIGTRNGFHYRTSPFNIQEFNKNFSPEERKTLVGVHPDGMLFVEYMKNE